MLMNDDLYILRESAETIESTRNCSICRDELTVAYDYRTDVGICIGCGFPYKIDAENERISSFTEPILYSSGGVSSNEIDCIKCYKDSEDRPAPLWSFSPLKSSEFIEFSYWALENGFERFSWIEDE